MGRYRIYEDLRPPLVVDTDRAYTYMRLLRPYNPGYFWAPHLSSQLAAGLFYGGFVALIWWPWWTPLLGMTMAFALYSSLKVSCADYVREIVSAHPEAVAPLAAAGVIRPDIPKVTVPD